MFDWPLSDPWFVYLEYRICYLRLEHIHVHENIPIANRPDKQIRKSVKTCLSLYLLHMHTKIMATGSSEYNVISF